MQICLVRPATVTNSMGLVHEGVPPLGLAYLGAVGERLGHDVTLVDAVGEGLDRYERLENWPIGLRHGLLDHEIIQRIPKESKLIGVTAMFSLEWPQTRDLILRIREHFPNASIVVGGEHVTAAPESSMEQCPAIDACALGEGETTFAAIIEALDAGAELDTVGGLCLRRGAEFVKTPAQKRIRELDQIPRPAWHLVPLSEYLDRRVMTGVNVGASMPVLASRGCPYQCTFCSNPVMWGTLWRPREVEEVLDEIADNQRRFGVTNIDFYDLTAIVKRSWILEFCQRIVERGMEFTWQLPAGTRSEALDDEVTLWMQKAGCRYVTYAPESGSPETLAKIRKKVDVEVMLKSMRGASKNGLTVKANIILGFPGETWKQLFQTFKLIARMAVNGAHDVACFSFSPYPGSVLFDEILAAGKVQLDDEFYYGLSLYSDPSQMQSYAERFSARQLGQLCIAGMILFYGLSFLLHPGRAFGLLKSLISRRPTSRLSDAMIRVMRKHNIWRHAR